MDLKNQVAEKKKKYSKQKIYLAQNNIEPKVGHISPNLKWFDFSVNIRHYESPSTSGPMLIRVSPLYGYYNLSVYYFCIFYRPL